MDWVNVSVSAVAVPVDSVGAPGTNRFVVTEEAAEQTPVLEYPSFAVT